MSAETIAVAAQIRRLSARLPFFAGRAALTTLAENVEAGALDTAERDIEELRSALHHAGEAIREARGGR